MSQVQRVEVVRLTAENRDLFHRIHCDAHGAGWCHCVAWWVPTWEGWGDRSAEENRALREDLFARGEFDGYFLQIDGEVAGWCQAGPRDRLKKLVEQFDLPPDPRTWALSCVSIAPHLRSQGWSRRFLAAVLDDLRERGVQRVESYPKRLQDPTASDLWNGAESTWRFLGFQVVQDDPERPVLALELA